MWVLCLFAISRREAGNFKIWCVQTQKAADSPLGESQLQRLMKPQSINALSPLRDGVPFSERLW
jgi:hypothetical protein